MSSDIRAISTKIEEEFIKANKRDVEECQNYTYSASFGRIFKQIIAFPFSLSGRILQLALHSINCLVAWKKGNNKMVKAELRCMKISLLHVLKAPFRLLFLPISLFYAIYDPGKDAKRICKQKSDDIKSDAEIAKVLQEASENQDEMEMQSLFSSPKRDNNLLELYEEEDQKSISSLPQKEGQIPFHCTNKPMQQTEAIEIFSDLEWLEKELKWNGLTKPTKSQVRKADRIIKERQKSSGKTHSLWQLNENFKSIKETTLQSAGAKGNREYIETQFAKAQILIAELCILNLGKEA